MSEARRKDSETSMCYLITSRSVRCCTTTTISFLVHRYYAMPKCLSSNQLEACPEILHQGLVESIPYHFQFLCQCAVWDRASLEGAQLCWTRMGFFSWRRGVTDGYLQSWRTHVSLVYTPKVLALARGRFVFSTVRIVDSSSELRFTGSAQTPEIFWQYQWSSS